MTSRQRDGPKLCSARVTNRIGQPARQQVSTVCLASMFPFSHAGPLPGSPRIGIAMHSASRRLGSRLSCGSRRRRRSLARSPSLDGDSDGRAMPVPGFLPACARSRFGGRPPISRLAPHRDDKLGRGWLAGLGWFFFQPSPVLEPDGVVGAHASARLDYSRHRLAAPTSVVSGSRPPPAPDAWMQEVGIPCGAGNDMALCGFRLRESKGCGWWIGPFRAHDRKARNSF